LSLLRIAPTSVLLAASIFSHHTNKSPVHEKPIRLRHLSGRIVDTKGLALPYAFVELRTSDDRPLYSTYADGNGHFSFSDRKRGELLELKVSLKGFTPLQDNVQIARIGGNTIRIPLQASH